MAPDDKFECSMPQGMWTGEFAANENYTNCAAPIEEPEQEVRGRHRGAYLLAGHRSEPTLGRIS